MDTVGQVDFARPLAVPPLAESHLDGDGRRVFDLVAQDGEREFVPGLSTPTRGFNGDHLGPTLRARQGERVAVRVRNDLDEVTTVHWHGMRLPAAMDGTPHQAIEPGETWEPTWTVDQPAATLWYHPHPHGETEKQVYQGLAGLFLVDDPEEAALDLPREYGVDDIPLVVRDVRLDGQGRLDRESRNPMGVLGDTVLVNGTAGPYLEVGDERVRLRLLNASTARVYDFGFADDRGFALVGTDGGLLAAPHRTTRVRLSPGERAEIVVDLVAGESTVLRSTPPDLGTGDAMTGRVGGRDTLDILEIRAAGDLRPAPPLPDTLADIPPPDPAESVTTREFVLSGRQINGGSMDMSRVDEVVVRDTAETWVVRNDHNQPHNFHVHDVRFRVLDLDGDPPPPPLSGWKDTVYVPPGGEVRLLIRFGPHTDPEVPYMYHCHLLLHEDLGMMGQFLVVEPGQEDTVGTLLDVDHDHG
ncbi:multicopper oxidase family protein [Actinoalloteichus caeruleus]|uniref:multicopper oxidase family protein n=1 Tax=Actinoalloteichus cyanogriseus TaxID=2893586 RepID=UPI001B802C9B|nr:multicopper oxidase domain-containing protein [Actinoalloteichus caeruleus]